VKMSGPYDWVPPGYWMLDSTHGGASGFNTETSPGAAVPPIESIERMFGGAVPWPIDSMWLYHAASGRFANFNAFAAALGARYGEPKSAKEFADKSQLMEYEGERAMFEAYSRNRGRSTGVVQWMLNNAWPGLWWHLYDYYLRPAGGYFGAKKALEPVHAMYSYDDRSIAVVNDTRTPVIGATVTARTISAYGALLDRRDTMVTILPDSVARVLTVPMPATASAYFVDVRITSTEHTLLSQNVYWLANAMDDLDWTKSTYYITPVTRYANLRALDSIPPTMVKRSMSVADDGVTETARVTLTNPGTVPAFFLRLQIVKGKGGDEVLPVIWSDNYVSLLPGEKRTVTATFGVAALGGRTPTLVVSGSNLISPDKQ
jgi:exo-1,4-beta-D-glucosaminidase